MKLQPELGSNALDLGVNRQATMLFINNETLEINSRACVPCHSLTNAAHKEKRLTGKHLQVLLGMPPQSCTQITSDWKSESSELKGEGMFAATAHQLWRIIQHACPGVRSTSAKWHLRIDSARVNMETNVYFVKTCLVNRCELIFALIWLTETALIKQNCGHFWKADLLHPLSWR